MNIWNQTAQKEGKALKAKRGCIYFFIYISHSYSGCLPTCQKLEKKSHCDRMLEENK